MIDILAQATSAPEAGQGAQTAVIIGIAAGVFLLVGLGMAVGVIFGRRPISGSCGGIGNITDEKGETSCTLCQNPGEACKELRKRMDPSEEHP